MKKTNKRYCECYRISGIDCGNLHGPRVALDVPVSRDETLRVRVHVDCAWAIKDIWGDTATLVAEGEE